jgi:hypothetical protein
LHQIAKRYSNPAHVFAFDDHAADHECDCIYLADSDCLSDTLNVTLSRIYAERDDELEHVSDAEPVCVSLARDHCQSGANPNTASLSRRLAVADDKRIAVAIT